MRLSELDTARAADVLCEISVYALAILSDEELMGTLKARAEESGVHTRAELMAYGIEKLSQLLPLLLKKHKADVFGILAALQGCPRSEIERQNVFKTMRQVREIAKDEELVTFFKSCAPGAKV